MGNVDLSRAVWRKSSRSSASGDCLEIAFVGDLIALRDSKNPAGPALVLGRNAWRTFVNGVENGKVKRP